MSTFTIILAIWAVGTLYTALQSLDDMKKYNDITNGTSALTVLFAIPFVIMELVHVIMSISSFPIVATSMLLVIVVGYAGNMGKPKSKLKTEKMGKMSKTAMLRWVCITLYLAFMTWQVVL